jgi:glycerol-3-phosphate acyltransferase PlsY
MPFFFFTIAILLAYLLGSIATSVWISKVFYGIDIRDYGSGNAGATNVFRVLGKKAGIPTMIIDMAKGWAAVKIALFFTETFPIGTNAYINMQLALGAAAVLGHLFPIFAGFRGGKGVATLFGIGLAIHPLATLLAFSVFVIVLITTRFVSLGSMLAGVTFPVLIIYLFKEEASSLIIFSFFVAGGLIYTHRKNIMRLLKRQESKANIFRKKSKSNLE